MATEVIKTIRASGGDYTSLSAWEAGEQADLVTADEIAVAECYDDWPTGLLDQLIMSGWTSDATRHPVIRVAAGEGHSGDSSVGFQIKRVATTHHESTISLSQYTKLIGARVLTEGGSNWSKGIDMADDCHVSKCIVDSTGSETPYYEIGYNARCKIYSNLILGIEKVGLFMSMNGSVRSEIYSNTIVGKSQGIKFDHWTNDDVDSNVFIDCTDDIVDSGFTDGGHAIARNGTNNAPVHADSTSEVLVDKLTDFVDAAGGNYKPVLSSVLQNSGIGLGLTSDLAGISLTDTGGGVWNIIGALRGVVEVIKVIAQSGGDYTGLSAWESGDQRDLVAVDEIAVAECEAFEDSYSTHVDISGWVANASCYIHVRAKVGHEHNGDPDSGYRFLSSYIWGGGLRIIQSHTRFEGIVVKKTSSSSTAWYNYSLTLEGTQNCLIDRVIGVGSWGPSIAFRGGRSGTIYRRCIALSTGNASQGFRAEDYYTSTAENCTAYNLQQGFVAQGNGSGKFVVKNCLAYNCSARGFNPYNAGFHSISDNNAAGDAETYAPPGAASILTNITADDFVSVVLGIYAPKAGSVLCNSGADIGLDSDIKSVSYTDSNAVSWLPIGAFRGVVEHVLTVQSDGLGDYTTLAAFESGEQGDLTANPSEAKIAACKGTLDINYLDFNGWESDETSYVQIKPQSAQEYNFDTDSGLIFEQGIAQYAIVVRAGVHLQIAGPVKYDTVGNVRGFIYSTSVNRNLLLDKVYTKDGYIGNGATTAKSAATNCFVDAKNITAGYLAQNFDYIRNCTFIAGPNSGSFSGQIAIRWCDGIYNTVVFNETIGGYDNFMNCTGDYNASNDASSPGANSIDNITTAEFADYNNGNYKLSSGSQLVDAGSDLSSEFLKDITDSARILPFDIGAFERLSSAIVLGVVKTLTSGASEQVAITATAGAANLIPSDTSQTSTSDQATIIQNHILAIVNSIQSMISDQASIGSSANLIASDTASSSASDSALLVQNHIISIVDTITNVLTDDVLLSQASILGMIDTIASQVSDQAALTSDSVVNVVETITSQISDDAGISQNSIISALDSISNSISDLAVIVGNGYHLLVASDTSTSGVSDAVVLAQNTTLIPQKTFTNSASDTIVVYSAGTLVAVDTAQAGVSETVQVLTDSIIITVDTVSGVKSDEVAIFENLTLDVIDTIQSQTCDVVILNTQNPGAGCGLTTAQNDMLVAIYNAITSTGARVAEVDKNDIAQKVWDEML